MSGPGWIGPARVVENFLAVVGADRDDEGRFIITGAPASSFMGAGDELVVPAETCYRSGGRDIPLAANMVSVMGQGPGRGLSIVVI